MGPRSVERIMQRIVRKLIFPNTLLTKYETLIHTKIADSIKIIHSNSSIEQKIYRELILHVNTCQDSNLDSKLDVWLADFHKALLFKLEKRIGWFSMINQLYMTKCCLNALDKYCSSQRQEDNYNSDFSLNFKCKLEYVLSRSMCKTYTKFLIEMGGWNDIFDFYSYNFEKTKLIKPLSFCLVVFLLFNLHK